MLEIIGKGFATAKKEGVRWCSSKLSLTGEGGERRGLFATSLSVDIAQLKSTLVVTRGHDRCGGKGRNPT